MEYSFTINNRAFKAIKNRNKWIEIRATKVGKGHFDYSILKPNEYIKFISFDNEQIRCKIIKVNWYKSIEKLFVAPCCDDTGQSIGNALYGYHHYFKNDRRISLSTPYLAREYSDEEIMDVLEKKQEMFILPYHVKSCNFNYKKIKNIEKETAELLSLGNIIGWFQGASEIGPRALGNRSILCAPYPACMKDILNEKIKHRENFRPFAPSILEEKAKEYFEIEESSPYMLKVPICKEKAKNKIPATLHIDYSGRVQTVNKEMNPKFYNLLVEFEKITGIPVLLNTSFNDNGEPIVESPKDALVMFCKSQLDYLIIGDYIIRK